MVGRDARRLSTLLEVSQALSGTLILKGIHISIPASKLPVRNLLVLNTEDKRRIFALRRGEVVYVGLSLVAKSALAWQVFANTLVPS